jgi:tRNA dimethylallyltransferase
VLCGPTAGGKTALAIALAHTQNARAHPAEIITADAFQVYQGMDIGTAKPTPEERAGIPHHLIDIVPPTQKFTASQWLALAQQTIQHCRSRGVLPIVVGGTHLYVKLLVEGMFEGPPADPALRAELAAMPRDALRAELERVDPVAAQRLHPNDLRRTIRALEIFRQTGTPISTHQSQWDTASNASQQSPSNYLLVCLDWPVEDINRRINARVKHMMEQGLAHEARTLWEARALGDTAREALGYKQLIAHFEGRCTLDEAVEQIKIETRRFAKNQRTWLKRLRAKPNSMALHAHPLSNVASSESTPPLRDWVEQILCKMV